MINWLIYGNIVERKQLKSFWIIANTPIDPRVREVQSFYFNKFQARSPTLIDHAPPSPPWIDSLHLPEPTHLSVCSSFTEVDIKMSWIVCRIINLVVVMEWLIKIHKLETNIIIFNTCFTNIVCVCKSWKGALVYWIPTKDNIPSNPSSWRDLPATNNLYNFHEMHSLPYSPWQCDESIISAAQKAYIERQAINEHSV